MTSLSDIDALQRLGLAMVVGVLLGLERERLDKPAGMRTYMLVVEGAALFMICAIMLSDQLWQSGRLSDPGRIASTVVQGIGFIAAGVIFTTSNRAVIGLTTAAGIWLATALGLLIGAGFFTIAIAATIVTLLALIGLRLVERHLLRTKSHQGDDI